MKTENPECTGAIRIGRSTPDPSSRLCAPLISHLYDRSVPWPRFPPFYWKETSSGPALHISIGFRVLNRRRSHLHKLIERLYLPCSMFLFFNAVAGPADRWCRKWKRNVSICAIWIFWCAMWPTPKCLLLVWVYLTALANIDTRCWWWQSDTVPIYTCSFEKNSFAFGGIRTNRCLMQSTITYYYYVDTFYQRIC